MVDCRVLGYTGNIRAIKERLITIICLDTHHYTPIILKEMGKNRLKRNIRRNRKRKIIEEENRMLPRPHTRVLTVVLCVSLHVFLYVLPISDIFPTYLNIL